MSGLFVLGLHRVGRPSANATIRGLFTSTGLLRFQIRLLKWLGFEFKTLSEAVLGPNASRTAVLTFDDGYEDNYHFGVPVLERENVPATVFVIASDVGKRDLIWDEAGDSTPADLMTWNMLKELGNRGWEIGSHCDEHVHLGRRSPHEQAKLIDAGLQRVEEHFGFRPVSFAYPYGSHDDSTVDALKQCGVRIAVTTNRPGTRDLRPAGDLLRVKRLAVGGWAWHHYVKVFIRTLRVAGPGLSIGGRTAIADSILPSAAE
jgi:peptidoglycan/xylan/chitin deacetylase (PgdA/CDA1 family)